MKTKYYGSHLLATFLTLVLLGLLSAQSYAANFPLEIIQPRPNLDTKNRFYKAYPGLEYNVRLAVIGGEFPYRYELITAPAGMTIDSRGEVSWPDPVKSATPYNVSVAVRDAQNAVSSVSWTVAVTMSGFRFIDAINGTSASLGGTGTLTNPWKSLKDMYEGDVYDSKYAKSYAGEFIYWRSGTYTMDAFKEDGGIRVPFVQNWKPLVWLTYPGESPVFDLTGAYISIYGGGSNTYFDGLEFNADNARGMGVAIESSANNVTFRRNKFFGISNNSTGGNNSLIFIAKGIAGQYYSIQDNEFYNVSGGYGILGYSAKNVLVENNILHNINGHPIGPKEGTARWFIRANKMYNNSMNSINVQYSDSSGIVSGDMEISYNFVSANGGKVRINSNLTASGLPVYVFRNTFLDKVQQNLTTSTNGIFKWYNNVIVNDTLFPKKIEQYRVENASRLIISNNLTGGTLDNIIDSQGFLTANYKKYIGTHGFQLDNRRPLPPVVTGK